MKEVLIRLYGQQAKIIYSYLLKRGCSKQDAEDIVQESFTKLVEHMDGLDKSQLSSWLFRVAINDYKNRCKKQSYERQGLIDAQHFKQIIAVEDGMDELLIIEEKGVAIRRCLDELNEMVQELLILKYDIELSYKEISLLLGIKEEQVKTYLYRARQAFKKKWRERHEE